MSTPYRHRLTGRATFRRGKVVVQVALLGPVLFGFAALAIDVGAVYVAKGARPRGAPPTVSGRGGRGPHRGRAGTLAAVAGRRADPAWQGRSAAAALRRLAGHLPAEVAVGQGGARNAHERQLRGGLCLESLRPRGIGLA